MRVRYKQVMEFWVTPQTLRTIADKLEREFYAARIGDDVPSHTFFGVEGEVRIVVDQENMPKEKGK